MFTDCVGQENVKAVMKPLTYLWLKAASYRVHSGLAVGYLDCIGYMGQARGMSVSTWKQTSSSGFLGPAHSTGPCMALQIMTPA